MSNDILVHVAKVSFDLTVTPTETGFYDVDINHPLYKHTVFAHMPQLTKNELKRALCNLKELQVKYAKLFKESGVVILDNGSYLVNKCEKKTINALTKVKDLVQFAYNGESYVYIVNESHIGIGVVELLMAEVLLDE